MTNHPIGITYESIRNELFSYEFRMPITFDQMPIDEYNSFIDNATKLIRNRLSNNAYQCDINVTAAAVLRIYAHI